ncbi:MAG: exo-alpha-sialidase [Verrucomicrobia bacterium]|nr:exo-alpha-sialidase [Verrucomicrobiota bacterium]
MKRICSLTALLLVPLVTRAADVQVTVEPVVTVRERPGITGAGWAVAYDVAGGAKTIKRIALIYPNHPDDWGKTGGTGLSYSSDGGRAWVAGPDNSPIPGMVDMWQDRLRNGELITFGIRSVPDREKALAGKEEAADKPPYAVGISKDRSKTWQTETAKIHCPPSVGVIARPLPRIFEDADGTMFMPAYAWSKMGNRALLLKSSDRGRNWNVASVIADAQAIRASGAALASPWVETAVVRTSDGSLLAVVRTGSSAKSALVTTRSTDGGGTWSPMEKVFTGPHKRIVAGKLPGLCLLPNGVLVLLTAHTKNHCRLYLSHDGTGREWSDGFIITSQGGGNTSMIATGPDKLLVFTPANGRIQCWHVTITRNAPTAKSALPAPSNITVTGTNVRVSWKAPADAGSVSHYLVIPILIKPFADNKDTEIYSYAPIHTRDAATQLELGRVLSIGGTYRIKVAAVDRDGRISPAASSAEVVAGTSSIPK